MALRLLLALSALIVPLISAQNHSTWVSTTFITEKYESQKSTRYGSAEVVPVSRSTTLDIYRTYKHESATSSDRTVTTWKIEQVTVAVSTFTSAPVTTLTAPRVITANGTSTILTWVSPILATVTFPPNACASSIQSVNGTQPINGTQPVNGTQPINGTSPFNGTSPNNSTSAINGTAPAIGKPPASGAPFANSTTSAVAASPTNGTWPARTVTKYTGTYAPFSGQVTTTPTVFPTAVTTYVTLTVSYRVSTHFGTVTTVTSTATGYNYLSTTTVYRNETVTVAPFRYNITVYPETTTVTSSDWGLTYTTASAPVRTTCPETTTVTRAAQCAPSNLIAERDGHGVAVLPRPHEWTFPIGFPPAKLDLPAVDASACCQLCLDNPGCGVSEWSVGWPRGCRLFYYFLGNDTCGAGTSVKYFADTNSYPRQATYVQAGCARLEYTGLLNPFCPTCEVTE